MRLLCVSAFIFVASLFGCSGSEEAEHEQSENRSTRQNSTVQSPSVTAVALSDTSKKCASCHAGLAEKTFHVKAGIDCESCHTEFGAHLKNTESKPFVPSQRADCTSCHANGTGPQIDAEKHHPNAFCAPCHVIHGQAKRSDDGDEGAEREHEDSESDRD